MFAPGEYETPSLPLTVREPDGSVSQVDSPRATLSDGQIQS